MCYICIVDMAEYNNLLLDQALNKRNIVLVLELHQQTKLSYFFPIEQQKYEFAAAVIVNVGCWLFTPIMIPAAELVNGNVEEKPVPSTKELFATAFTKFPNAPE